MIRFTDDPAADVTRMYEENEHEWYEENRKKRCEICQRPIARLRHYDFDGVIVCPNCIKEAFVRDLIAPDTIDEMTSIYEVNNGEE